MVLQNCAPSSRGNYQNMSFTLPTSTKGERCASTHHGRRTYSTNRNPARSNNRTHKVEEVERYARVSGIRPSAIRKSFDSDFIVLSAEGL